MKDTVRFWNKTSKKYDTQVNSKYSETYNKTINNTRKYLNDNDVVLDYACGTGITTIPLSNNVQKVYAIDISEEIISIARDKAIGTLLQMKLK